MDGSNALGRFYDYMSAVKGCMNLVGMTHAFDNREVLLAEMAGTADWNGFIQDWWRIRQQKPVAPADLLPAAEDHSIEVKGESEKARATSLGMLLSAKRAQTFPVEGTTVQLCASRMMSGNTWRLLPVESGK